MYSIYLQPLILALHLCRVVPDQMLYLPPLVKEVVIEF